MPNWANNTLTIKGTKEEITRFRKKAKAKGTDLSLNNLYRMPKELEHTQSPANIVPDEQYDEAVAKAHASSEQNPSLGLTLPLTQTMSDALLAKYGADNWYDWHTNMWGTKWDVDATLYARGDTHLIYNFDSAWSPPIAWLVKVAGDFPTLEFTLAYEEPGVGFRGVAHASSGTLDYDEWDEYSESDEGEYE